MKDEFYSSKEFKTTTEYQAFPAEVYWKPTEENYAGVEKTDSGKEITTLQHSSKKEKVKKNSTNLVEKIFNSIKGAATVSTIAVVAVAGTTSAISNLPDVDLVALNVASTYIEYEMTVDDLDFDKDYAIVISTSNEDDISFPVNEDGTYENKVEGLKPQWEYSLSFVSIDNTMGETIVFEKTFQTTATDPDPPAALPDFNMAITAVEVVGLNKIRVSFDCENLLPDCSAKLNLTKDNLTETDVLTLTSRDLSVGFVEMPVDSNISTLSILPSITYDDGTSTMDFEPYQHTFDNTLECDIQVVVPNNTVVFDLKAISGDGVIAVVVDLDTDTILTEWELAWEGEIISTSVSTEFSPDTPTVNYGVYITDASGQKTSTDFVAEVKTSVDVRPDFTFNYKNPGDVGITYNNDGTINTYIATDFQCDNPDVYYQVTLGDLKFISRDQIFCGLNLPDETYSLTYDVCIDQDGVQYSLFTVSPSGTVNELRADSLISYEYMTTEFDLTLFVFSYYADRVDRDVVRIVSSTGEEVILTESNWVFNEDADEYTCVVHFDQYFDYADIYVVCSPTANIIESYGDFEYVGSVSKEFIVRIYT